MRDKSMLDAASGGALVDKTPTEARNLITNMAANSQQFGDRHDWPIRRVNEVGVNSEIQFPIFFGCMLCSSFLLCYALLSL